MLKVNIVFEGQRQDDIQSVAISVYDGFGRVIREKQEAEWTMNIPVDDGLYTVRAEIGGDLIEEKVRVSGVTSVSIYIPALYTPTPLEGSATSHEYYQSPSVALSMRSNYTAPFLGQQAIKNSELMIVLRTNSDAENSGKDLGRDLMITDLQGRPLQTLDESACTRNDRGFQGFRVEAAPDVYALTLLGKQRRVLFFQTFPDKQTQIFITYINRPVIEEAGILIAKADRGFQPSDEENWAADMAIRGLINDSDWMPREAMKLLLHGKFDSPMLGLLGAFILLKRKEPDFELLKTMVGNLDWLIPGSVDVRILKKVLARHLPDFDDADEEALRQPPMLFAAMEWAISLSWENLDWIPRGALTESVSLDMFLDSAWTTWLPDPGWGLADKLSPVEQDITKLSDLVGDENLALLSADVFQGIVSDTPFEKIRGIHSKRMRSDEGEAEDSDWVKETILARIEALRQSDKDVDEKTVLRIFKNIGLPGSYLAALLAQIQAQPQ